MNAPAARSSAAKKTTSTDTATAAATPAKKTTAAPAARKRAATPRKTTAKKTTGRKGAGRRPALSLVKSATAQARRPAPRTLHPDFSDAEVYEARAALHATAAGIRIPNAGWTASYGGGAEQLLPGGIRLRHGGRHGDPFTASIPCLLGALHVYDDVRTAADLDAALRIANTCDQPHVDLSAVAFGPADSDAETTVTLPLQQAPQAEPTAPDTPQDGDS